MPRKNPARRRSFREGKRTIDCAATEYAREIIAGKIPACEWVRLACERYLNDFKRRDLVFDLAEAERVVNFAESFRHYKGEWAGRRIELAPFQKFVLQNLFGWKRKKDGLRRFRYCHLEVPRKNGKTILAAIVGLYLLAADEEGGAEVYNAATKKDQAMILWKDARVLVERCKDPDFIECFTIKKNPAVIELEWLEGFMKPLGRDTDGETTDGLNPHGLIEDETHAWRAAGFWNVLNSALGARSQPLTFMITTAGHYLESVGHTHHKIAKRILSGESAGDGDDYFAVIYSIDKGDGHEDLASYAKANPLWGVTVTEDKVKSQLSLANADPAILRETKTKWLNVWLSEGGGWLDMKKWNAADVELDPKKLEGLRCYTGLDLSMTRDLSAKINIFPPQEDLDRWTVLAKFWCPTADIRLRSKRDKVPYQTWAEKGFLIPTPGEVTDHGYIQRDILEDEERFQVEAVGYDRTFSHHLIQPLLDEGVNMLAVSQGILTISPYAKELERLVIEGNKLNHFGHPVLTWCAGNTVVHTDANGNIKPDKKRSSEKIDGVIALIMALGTALEFEYDGGEEEGEVTVL